MKKESLFVGFAVLACAAGFAMQANNEPVSSRVDVPVVTPGGFPKKYVGLFFDVFNTTPSNILANADQFAEQTPYLDGVAIGLNNVPVVDTKDGSVVTSKFHLIMHATQRWTRDAVKDQLPYLREIAKKPHLTESVLLFWLTPGGRGNRIAWDDDKGWANFAENMATVAWLAKEAGLKGLMLDPEEYGAQGGQFAQYILCHTDPPYEVSAKLARQRGREVFSRIFKEFPDAVIWTLWYFNKFGFWLQNGRQPFPGSNLEQSGEVLHHFYNGILDVLPSTARIVDGAEHYSGSALDNAYLHDFVKMSSSALALVEPENLVKYRSQVYFGNTHYFDMYRTNANPRSLWYHGPVNGSRLEHMWLNFEQSLRVATGYVWLYGEGTGKLFNWRNGHYAKQKTWEELAPGMTETIMLVKNPLGLAAKRKAILGKKDDLVNLAEDFKGLKLAPTSAERLVATPENRIPSVKGLKAGERYHIVLNVVEHGAEKDTFRDGAARMQAHWCKNGARLAEKPLTFKIDYARQRNNRKALPASLTVVVPEGADGLLFDLSANLKLGERVCYFSLEMFNLLDAAKPAAASTGRWVFDPKEKTLTDGNWKLNAAIDKRKGTMTVRGDDDKTVGAGVLDFTNVKADTGYTVTGVGRLRNLPSLTALIAPDAVNCVDRGFAGSSNVSYVVVGEMKVPKSAQTPAEVRVEQLKRLGCTRHPSNFRIFDLRHAIVSRPNFTEGMSVKGVKPGELYVVGLSMKRTGPGYAFLDVRFRGKGEEVKSKELVPSIVMPGPRKEGVWDAGEVVLRIPEGADELYYSLSFELFDDHSTVAVDRFKVYKIGEPLPVWPAETVREKERRK